MLDNKVAVAGFTEEMAKFLVGRRYRQKLSEGIRCRGVVACVSSAALGLSYTSADGFLATISDGLFRAVFAFPLHIGTVRAVANLHGYF
jgi:hypothetical protein